jgi:hypothetical protein
MHSIQNKDDEAVSLAGVSASSPARRSGQTVILSFQADRRRYLGLEEASSPDWEVPPTIGELAVRIVGRFKLPKVKVLAQGRRGLNPAPASAHSSWEEEP